MKRIIHIQVESEFWNKISELAKLEGRTVSNYVRYLLSKHIDKE